MKSLFIHLHDVGTGFFDKVTTPMTLSKAIAFDIYYIYYNSKLFSIDWN